MNPLKPNAMYYERKEIKTQADLPKEKQKNYIFHDRGGSQLVRYISYCPVPETTPEHYLNAYDWYLQPISDEEYQRQLAFEAACNPDLMEAQTNYKLYRDKIESLEELCALRGELIVHFDKLLEILEYRTLDGSHSSVLRQRINELEKKLKG
jgi:hypothetical protein